MIMASLSIEEQGADDARVLRSVALSGVARVAAAAVVAASLLACPGPAPTAARPTSQRGEPPDAGYVDAADLPRDAAPLPDIEVPSQPSTSSPCGSIQATIQSIAPQGNLLLVVLDRGADDCIARRWTGKILRNNGTALTRSERDLVIIEVMSNTSVAVVLRLTVDEIGSHRLVLLRTP
jgi:hypothetical protein